jgi:hypothetical protein
LGIFLEFFKNANICNFAYFWKEKIANFLMSQNLEKTLNTIWKLISSEP